MASFSIFAFILCLFAGPYFAERKIENSDGHLVVIYYKTIEWKWYAIYSFLRASRLHEKSRLPQAVSSHFKCVLLWKCLMLVVLIRASDKPGGCVDFECNNNGWLDLCIETLQRLALCQPIVVLLRVRPCDCDFNRVTYHFYSKHHFQQQR